MNSPMISHTKKRSQVSSGRLSISTRQQRNQRNAEAARALRLLPAQHNDAGRDQNKCEQRSDVRKIREPADVEDPGGNPDHEASYPGADVGRAVARMHA